MKPISFSSFAAVALLTANNVAALPREPLEVLTGVYDQSTTATISTTRKGADPFGAARHKVKTPTERDDTHMIALSVDTTATCTTTYLTNPVETQGPTSIYYSTTTTVPHYLPCGGCSLTVEYVGHVFFDVKYTITITATTPYTVTKPECSPTPITSTIREGPRCGDLGLVCEVGEKRAPKSTATSIKTAIHHECGVLDLKCKRAEKREVEMERRRFHPHTTSKHGPIYDLAPKPTATTTTRRSRCGAVGEVCPIEQDVEEMKRADGHRGEKKTTSTYGPIHDKRHDCLGLDHGHCPGYTTTSSSTSSMMTSTILEKRHDCLGPNHGNCPGYTTTSSSSISTSTKRNKKTKTKTKTATKTASS